MQQKIRSLIQFNLVSLLLVIGCIGLFSAKVVSSETTLTDLKENYPKVIYDINLKIVETHRKNTANNRISYVYRKR